MRKTSRNITSLSLALCFLLLAAACNSVVPEKFTANLRLLGKYGYVEYSFKGDVLVADAAIDIMDGKKSQTETDKQLVEIQKTILENEKNAAQERQFRKLQYLGKNRFSVEQVVKASLLEDISFFQSEESSSFVEIISHPADDSQILGEYTIKAFEVDGELRDKLNVLNVTQQGTFNLETDGQVISHNAHKVASNGVTTVYTWYIDGKKQTPVTLKLKAQQPRLTRH